MLRCVENSLYSVVYLNTFRTALIVSSVVPILKATQDPFFTVKFIRYSSYRLQLYGLSTVRNLLPGAPEQPMRNQEIPCCWGSLRSIGVTIGGSLLRAKNKFVGQSDASQWSLFCVAFSSYNYLQWNKYTIVVWDEAAASFLGLTLNKIPTWNYILWINKEVSALPFRPSNLDYLEHINLNMIPKSNT